MFKNKLIKLIGIFAFVMTAFSANAASGNTPNGELINKGIRAYERTFVIQTGTPEDGVSAAILVTYVSGILAVHRQNNFLVRRMLISKPNLFEVQSDLGQLQLFHLVPLLNIPDNIPTDQIISLLKKYMSANPEKWSKHAATLILEAFIEAYPMKR